MGKVAGEETGKAGAGAPSFEVLTKGFDFVRRKGNRVGLKPQFSQFRVIYGTTEVVPLRTSTLKWEFFQP
jgi:hypothetical protein